MKLLKWLDQNFEKYISIALMTMMTVIIFVQVIMRRVFSNSLSWSEELARYMFIWLIYFGISYGAKTRKHIKIEALMGIFPSKARPVVEIIGDFMFLGFSLYIAYTSFVLVQKQIGLGQTSPALQIPMAVIYAAPMVGFALTAVRQVQTILYRVQVLTGRRQAAND